MQEFVTSFLIQSKHCRLKDVGNFSLLHTAEKTDIANKKLVPQKCEVVYTSREEKISEDLVKYVAAKKNISENESLEGLLSWCSDTRKKLDGGEEVFFKPLGFLKKSSTGIAFFQNKNIDRFFVPVTATRVIRKNSSHQVLVGDKEVTSAAMSRYYEGDQVSRKRSGWKLIAIALLIIAIVFLFYYFSKQPFTFSRTGNQQVIDPKAPPATYTTP